MIGLFKQFFTPCLEVELDGGHLPQKAHPHDAGYDLALADDLNLAPGTQATVDLRIRILIPSGYAGLIFARSSIAAGGLDISNSVIDAGYTGHIYLIVRNNSGLHLSFKSGMRLAQLLLVPVPAFTLTRGTVSNRSTHRGERGFGSSGTGTEVQQWLRS